MKLKVHCVRKLILNLMAPTVTPFFTSSICVCVCISGMGMASFIWTTLAISTPAPNHLVCCYI